MVDPFSLTAELVKGLVESVEGVSTNREECELLVERAKQTLVLLNHIRSRIVADQAMSSTLDDVNKALTNAQAAIDNCCRTNYIWSMILHKTHTLELKRADKDLSQALMQIPLAAVGLTLDIKEDLATLVDSKSHQIFEERAARVNQTNVLKKTIEEMQIQMNQGFEAVSVLTHQAIKEPSAQTSQAIGEGPSQASQVPEGASAQTSKRLEGSSAQTKQEIENTNDQTGQIQKQGSYLEKTVLLMVTMELVKDISDASTKVKTNEGGCILLVGLAEETLVVLEKLDESAFANSFILDALHRVNEALSNVKHFVDDYCKANLFEDATFHKKYSSRLREVATILGIALAEMSPLLHGTSQTRMSSLSGLCNEIKNEEFDESGEVGKDTILTEKPNDVVEASQPLRDYNGPFPLHFAVSNDWIDVIKELVDNGVNVNLLNENGESPLYIASEKNSIGIVKELIANGADVNVQDDYRLTPMHIASQNGHIDVVKELIANGAKVYLRNTNGNTPLHVATTCGRVHIVQALLENGASKNVKNNKYYKAYDVVCTDQSFGPYDESIIEELNSLLSK